MEVPRIAYIHVAAVNQDAEPVLAAVRELGAERVILVRGNAEDAADRELADILEPLGVQTQHETVPDPMLLGTIRLLQRIADEHRDRPEDLIVNLAGASRYQACAFLSAAFVAGVRTIDREAGEIRFLPVLRFAYDEIVGPDKLDILQALSSLGGSATSLKAITKHTSLPSSSVSYELRGGQGSDGLEDLGLVEIQPDPGVGVTITLTPMGELLADGMTLEASEHEA